MAYIVMAYRAMAYIFMACVVMASGLENPCRYTSVSMCKHMPARMSRHMSN